MAGWQASVAASSFITGTLVQGLVELADPDYTPKPWHATFFLYGTLLICVVVNTVIGSALPKVETGLFILWVMGFFACLIPLVCLAPHSSSQAVFKTFLNGGGWNTQGLSFFVGLSGNAFAFLGIFQPPFPAFSNIGLTSLQVLTPLTMYVSSVCL